MLEEFATNYVIEAPERTVGYMLGLMLVGGLASAFYPKSSDSTLTRAPYVFYFGLAYFLVSLVDLPSAKTPQAIETGTAWILVLTSALGDFAFGFFMGRLAAARSRDAYGHAGAAVLAFIPFANLWLYFVRSKGESAARKPIWVMRGFVGVLAGFIFLALGNAAMNEAARQKTRAFVESTSVTPDILARFLVNNTGLEDTLAFYANSISLPMELDMATTMTSVEAHGDTLEMTYRVAGLWGQIFGVSKDDVVKTFCQTPINPPLLRAGAIFKHIYNDPDGRELAKVTVTRQDCGL